MDANIRKWMRCRIGRVDTMFLLSAAIAAQILSWQSWLVEKSCPGHDKCLGELSHKEP